MKAIGLHFLHHREAGPNNSGQARVIEALGLVTFQRGLGKPSRIGMSLYQPRREVEHSGSDDTAACVGAFSRWKRRAKSGVRRFIFYTPDRFEQLARRNGLVRSFVLKYFLRLPSYFGCRRKETGGAKRSGGRPATARECRRDYPPRSATENAGNQCVY